VGSTGDDGRAGTNREDIGSSASRAAAGRLAVVRTRAHRRGDVSIAQLTRGKRLKAGTYLLEVTSLDDNGRAVSRKSAKFWVLRPR